MRIFVMRIIDACCRRVLLPSLYCTCAGIYTSELSSSQHSQREEYTVCAWYTTVLVLPPRMCFGCTLGRAYTPAAAVAV